MRQKQTNPSQAAQTSQTNEGKKNEVQQNDVRKDAQQNDVRENDAQKLAREKSAQEKAVRAKAALEKASQKAQLHSHPHRKAVSRRVAITVGHLKGVQRMIEEGEDCCEILDQLSAVRSAINSSARVLLDDHIKHCLYRAYKENDVEMIKRITDAIKKYMNL